MIRRGLPFDTLIPTLGNLQLGTKSLTIYVLFNSLMLTENELLAHLIRQRLTPLILEKLLTIKTLLWMSCSVDLFCCPVLASRPGRPVLFWVSFSVGPVIAVFFPPVLCPGQEWGVGLIRNGVFIFREIRLLLPVGCDYRDYRNFFRLNNNRYFAIITNFFV